MKDAHPSKEALLEELQILRHKVARLEAAPPPLPLLRSDDAQEGGFFDAIMRTSVTALAMLDTQGRIFFANDRAERILGLTRDEIVGRSYNAPEWKIADFDGGPFPDEDLPFSRVIKTGEPVFDIQHAIEWPGGLRKLLSINGAPLRDEAGAISSIVFSIEDITQRVRADEKIRRLNAELKQRVIERTAQLDRDITERKRAEARLRASERRFRAVFEKSGVGVTLCGLHDRYLQTNPAFQAMLGYTEEELQQMTFWEVTHPDDLEREREILKDAAEATVRYEKRYIRQDDEVIWTWLTASFVKDDDGTPLFGLGIVEDITEHKQAEEALRANEARHRALVHAIPDALFRMDRNGVYLDFVPAEGFETLVPPEVFLGKTVHEVLPAETAERSMHFIEEALRTKERQRFEYAMVRGGEKGHFEVRVVPDEADSVLAILRDITEQKQAEETIKKSEARLRESQEKFSKAFHASSDVITITRLHDGLFLEVNDGFERLTGYRREEVLGKTSTEMQIWQVDDRERMVEPLRREGKVRDLETGLVMKSGLVRACMASADVIEIGGEPCLVAITRDITERKVAEREREHLIDELEAKNAELERFTYTVSHDLKSPLVTIKGFLGLLEQDAALGDADRVRKDIDHINRAADKMQQLLSQLLELSRIGRLVNPPEAVSLTGLAREAVEQVAGQITARGVSVEIAPSMPVVTGDQVRLLEVLQNLVENAVKYMGDQPAPRIVIQSREEAGQVVCFVQDNGIGIDPTYHEKVFVLFERLDAATEGTGIGLALAKRIVEIHGGRIWVESEGVGHGATFCFTLPGD